jgi:long-subunit fatty acid transport protein
MTPISGISRSHLAPLDQTAGMLSMGLRWRASEKWSVDFGFSEDVVVETAPDINFLLNVRVALDP